MLGPLKARDLDRPVFVSLDAVVPKDHFYRHLHRALDLSFVRGLAADCYATGGRPSIDPEAFFRLQLLMSCSGIRSERQLMEQVGYNLALRRGCPSGRAGYNLDEPLPDRSSLSKTRARLGLPVFRRFFEAITAHCIRAGLVWGDELIFDATKVRANASMDSRIPRLRLLTEEHLAELEPPAPPTALWDQNNARWDLLDECRLDPARPASGGYERESDRLVSTTDSDAAPMKTTGQQTTRGYHDHYAIDGGKARIILDALVTPADVMENAPMLPLLRRAIFRRRVKPKRVVADTTYGTADNIREIEESGIRAYVPLPDWERRTVFFGPSLFTYDAERDIYLCPRGEVLRRQKVDRTARKIVRYRADAAVCNACPVKAACTAGEHGRGSPRGSMGRFGEARQGHGMRRFRLRGLPKVNMEGLLIAAGQDLKRLLSAGGWGRRPWPDGGAGFAGSWPNTRVIPV